MSTFVMIMVLKMYGYAPTMATADFSSKERCIEAGEMMKRVNKDFEYVCTER